MKLKKYKKKKIGSYISFGIIMIIFSLILSFVVIDYVSSEYDQTSVYTDTDDE